jgi:hypothetical protein
LDPTVFTGVKYVSNRCCREPKTYNTVLFLDLQFSRYLSKREFHTVPSPNLRNLYRQHHHNCYTTHPFPNFVGFEFLTPVTMNSTIFWKVRPCGSIEVHSVSQEYPHLLSQKVKEINWQHAAGKPSSPYCLFPIVYLLGILFDPGNRGSTFLQNTELLADSTASYSKYSIHYFLS